MLEPIVSLRTVLYVGTPRHSPVYRDALYYLTGYAVIDEHFLRGDSERYLKGLLAASFSLERNRFTYMKKN